MKAKISLPPDVKKFFVSCGIKGGSSTSKAKTEASRKNGCAPCNPGKIRGRPPLKKNYLNGKSFKTIHE